MVQNLANKHTLPKMKIIYINFGVRSELFETVLVENIIIKCITYLNDKAQASPCSNPGRVNFIFLEKRSTSSNTIGNFHTIHKSKNWFCQTLASGEWIVIDLFCEGAI